MAWMSVDQMKAEIIRAYPGKVGWALRVYDMPDKQVAAIYKRMLNNGELKKDHVIKKVPMFEKKPDISAEELRAEVKKYGEYCGEQIRFDI